MDYEKKYKEALKRAKAAIDIGADKDLVKGVAKTIFPELSESEDERIRKEISILYSDIDACITELLKARTNKDTEAEGKALFKMEGLMVGTLQDLSCIEAYLEKRKEPYYTKRNALFDKCVAECDPEIIQRVSDEVDEMLGKEQKPAEWSEEDEDMLNSCISSIEEAKENRYAYKENDGDTSYDREIKWLKSLRPQPHWKPSEEQMGCLERVIAFKNPEPEDIKGCEELLEQLRKL